MKRIVIPVITCILAVAALFFLHASSNTTPESVEVAVLMYHHFAEETNWTTVSEAEFRDHLTALDAAGYETVTTHELLDYVEGDGTLPEKPLLITMDDGYTSNLTAAGPILEEFSMTATVFVIGINEGQTIYAHSGNPLLPARFAYEEALPWVEKGVLDVQSHTYDLHQLESYGFSGRNGMLQLAEESPEAYTDAILQDCKAFREARSNDGLTELIAIAYPFGYHTTELDQMLESEFAVTFTIAEHLNTITQGDLSTLRMLGRFNVPGGLSGNALVQKLEAAAQAAGSSQN